MSKKSTKLLKKLDELITAIKERSLEMPLSRSTKAQNWSYSQVFTAVEMESTTGKRDSLDAARAGWEASAAANGYKVKKDASTTESLTPMWRTADGSWTDGNAGTAAEGFKVTISGAAG